MKTLIHFFLLLIVVAVRGQVGINTQKPETTLEVVGKPSDPNHFDGIIPPRISGNQLAAKTYSATKKGAVVYVLSPASNLSGQAIHLSEAGLYYFDGIVWQTLTKGTDTVEYMLTLSFDENSTEDLQESTTWSAPVNYWAAQNIFLTSIKYYKIGTKNYGGIKGLVRFIKNGPVVSVLFKIYRPNNFSVNNDALIPIAKIFSDLGMQYSSYAQIVLLHTENSTDTFPLLLQNQMIQIPARSINAMSSVYYTFGEVQTYSNALKPRYP